MELRAIKCPACGAGVNIDNNDEYFKCNYCQNQLKVIRSINISNDSQLVNESSRNQFNNYLRILEQSMLAGNYSEAYDYCNKALELNPNNASLWENKAVCAYFLTTDKELKSDLPPL